MDVNAIDLTVAEPAARAGLERLAAENLKRVFATDEKTDEEWAAGPGTGGCRRSWRPRPSGTRSGSEARGRTVRAHAATARPLSRDSTPALAPATVHGGALPGGAAGRAGIADTSRKSESTQAPPRLPENRGSARNRRPAEFPVPKTGHSTHNGCAAVAVRDLAMT